MKYFCLVALALLLAAVPPSSASDNSTQPETPALRAARLEMQLAEANLTRVQRINQKLAGSVSADVIAEFREASEVAKLAYEQARKPDGGDSFLAWLRRAESRQKTAQSEYVSAVAANRRLANTIDELDIDRMRLRAELAKAQYDLGQQLAHASPAEQAQWQLSLMSDDVERLREESLRNIPSTRVYYQRWR